VNRALIAAGAVLVGLAAGGLWTLLQSDRYRADSRVLVRSPVARVLPAVEALAQSSLVAANVAQTLHLSSPPDLRAKAGKGGVLTVSVDAGSRERARQIDAEAVVVLTQKVPQRFPAASVTVLDPAHVAEQTSPTPGRNLLITGLAGLVAGVALAGALSSRRPEPVRAAGPDPRVERRLQARLDQVAKRERALGRRAGELAAREQDLARRERALERTQADLAMREEEARRAPAVEPVVPAPEPEPPPEPIVPRPAAGSWTIEELERLVAVRGETSPERADEWRTYLFFLREHANIDGSLPRSFDSLIADVFGPA
jgi:capsular polysaccharide biosynthesis protein